MAKSKNSPFGLCGSGAVALAAALLVSSPAWGEADGPDAWRVAGVADNDVLNVRMGPGTQYEVIGTFAHDARGLVQITCVPLVTSEHHFAMTEAERTALPPRWCLMHNADTKGWVAQRFLAEDVSQAPSGSAVSDPDGVQEAAQALVRKLYSEHLRALSGDFTSPLHPARAHDFFTAPLADAIARRAIQADPLFDAQDSQITDLRVALDPDQPMFRGMITVNAEFANFGHPRRAVIRLRYENGEPRVFAIEHEGWTFQ